MIVRGSIIKGVTYNLHVGGTVVYHIGKATWDCQFEMCLCVCQYASITQQNIPMW